MVGRPERPVDPAAGPAAMLAAELRALRDSVGAPSYRSLAQRTHYSVSTLSQAAAGRTLPSLPVLRAFVVACGGDPDAWERKWQAAQRAAAAAADAGGAAADADARAAAGPPVGTGYPPVRRRRLLPGYAIVAAMIAAMAFIVIWLRPGTPPTTLASAPFRGAGAADPVADGSDPNRAGCGPGAVTLAITNVHFPDATLAGRLELRYSPRCRAAWSRFQPAAGWAPGAGVVITVWTIRPADQATQYYTVPYGGEDVIGNMLMTAKGCIAAEVSLVQGADASPVATTQCMTIGS